MLKIAVCGIWMATTITALIAIYGLNLRAVKQKCRSWDGTKSYLFATKIRQAYADNSRGEVAPDRERLPESEDCQIILRQARLTWYEMAAAMLGIFAISAAIFSAAK